MASTLPTARLRARLCGNRVAYSATERDLALEYTRRCPRDVVGWASLATSLTDLGLYSKARIALKRLERLDRGEDPYLVCVRWGSYHKAMGNLKRAEMWYRKAAEDTPAALVFLGGVLARQGRLAEAKRCHRQASRAPAHDRLARDEAYFNLGLMFRAERRYREALANFDRAISLDPKYALALEARADVKTAVKVDVPNDERSHWRRMLDALGPNPATSHELVRAYTRRYPRRFGGWVWFAEVLAGFARYDEAAESLRTGERLAKSEHWKEPPEAFFAVQWGFLYQQKSDFRRAESMFRRAVSLRPSESNLTYLGEILVVEGRHSEAQRCLQRAIRLGGKDPSIAYYQLALIARARGQYADALKSLDEVRHHSPKYPRAVTVRRDVREAMNVAVSR